MADFPTALTGASDNVTDVLAKHLNNLEAKVGINDSTDTDSLDYLLKALPEGGMINGKISVTVASNNLTVALKAFDGNDASATNPIYVNIAGVIRKITAALSVTRNAGTNWSDAASSTTVAKEIDYFVYLGYNASDGVVIGFSRVPYGARYDSFSTTNTLGSYCAISTITNAAVGDYYNLIGRFAASLSAGGSYNWSVPTFTAANLIQHPIYFTRWLDWIPVFVPVGGLTYTSLTHDNPKYMISYKTAHVVTRSQGTAGGTAYGDMDLTMPINKKVDNACPTGAANYFTSAWVSACICEAGSTSNIRIHHYDGSNWANSGTLLISVAVFYEII